MGAGNHEDIGPERIYAIAKSSPPLLSWLVFSRHCDLWLALRCSCRAWRQAAARINLNLTPKQPKLQKQPNRPKPPNLPSLNPPQNPRISRIP